jgi:hypothetical protein
MKRALYLMAFGLAVWGSAANAASITVFNTGVDSSGAPLADGTIGDTHYSLAFAPSGTTDILVRTSVGGYPIGPYIGDDTLSAWIGPNNDSQVEGPAGLYDYQTTFDLTGFDPTTASLTGVWAADDGGMDILINGVSVGAYTSSAFTDWSAFTISSGFVEGMNTLDFMVNNDGGPTALRTEYSGTATATPEPASMILLGTGLVGLCVLRKRMTASPRTPVQ